MTIHKLTDIFTEEELKSINEVIDSIKIPSGSPQENMGTGVDIVLGRLQIGNLDSLPHNIINKVTTIAKDLSGLPLALDHALYVEYNEKYGQPNLPPHFDGDTNDLIINYQLSSNTTWNLGLDLKVYALEDNSAAVFNANKTIHWRPHKTFKDDEYVKMIFFRFYNSENRSDYSHMQYLQGDDIYKEVRELRDSLIKPYI